MEYLVVCFGFEPVKLFIPLEKNNEADKLIEEFADNNFNGQEYEVINLNFVETKVL